MIALAAASSKQGQGCKKDIDVQEEHGFNGAGEHGEEACRS